MDARKTENKRNFNGRNCVLEMHTLNDSYKISKLFMHEKDGNSVGPIRVLVSTLTLSLGSKASFSSSQEEEKQMVSDFYDEN